MPNKNKKTKKGKSRTWCSRLCGCGAENSNTNNGTFKTEFPFLNVNSNSNSNNNKKNKTRKTNKTKNGSASSTQQNNAEKIQACVKKLCSLGVIKDDETIDEKKFKKSLLKFHPDKQVGKNNATIKALEEEFKQVNMCKELYENYLKSK